MTYTPPPADAIAQAQNDDVNLRLLLVQRRLYSRAKVWSGARGLGVGLVAIGAPIATALSSDVAVAAATTAAVWFTLNRLVFGPIEARSAALGATAQEQFDTAIFGMPRIAVRTPGLIPEEVRRLTGGKIGRKKAYSNESLRNWYPIQVDVDGAVAIAISQRANLAYSQTLLARNAAFWLALLVTWAATAVGIGIASDFDVLTFLLVIVLPILPPLLDAVDEALRVRSAGRERRALADVIQASVDAHAEIPIEPDQLLAWQSQLFALRRDSPLVPDWLYWLLRPRTEDEMNDAASTIAADLNRKKDGK
jgi:hypothetical protein